MAVGLMWGNIHIMDDLVLNINGKVILMRKNTLFAIMFYNISYWYTASTYMAMFKLYLATNRDVSMHVSQVCGQLWVALSLTLLVLIMDD